MHDILWPGLPFICAQEITFRRFACYLFAPNNPTLAKRIQNRVGDNQGSICAYAVSIDTDTLQEAKPKIEQAWPLAVNLTMLRYVIK